MFQKILIANRGEIAVRIIRACQEMGIATVAVYSAADVSALHVGMADEAVCIGQPSPSDSYLRGDKIVEVAQRLHCDAIHPGYGFLAENADFAEVVTAAGLAWIGPGAAAMRVMGTKTAARSAMAAAGVPVIPGFQASTVDADLIGAAQTLGFPLLVKAAAGGGGKGMRIVRQPEDLPAALASARREAASAFGDDQLYLETLIEGARHIEFQIFGDQGGAIVHLFERECSIQRRHQKIIEETPSPNLNDDLRRRMGAAVVAAARAVNYVNAGTVEFLLDERSNFYFLEMNTRLQVEHPITELVTGIDLVKTQIRVAAGEPLPFNQDELSQRGHAIECRIYAEDPGNGFLPATGKVLLTIEPVGPGVRADAGVGGGDEITVYYDPLIAKLAVLAENRHDAIARLDWALRHYVILGDVVTNIGFLRALLQHEAFRRGQATTAFVEQTFANWQSGPASPPDLVLIAAALAEHLHKREPLATDGMMLASDPYSPWRSPNGFRLGEQNPTLTLPSLGREPLTPLPKLGRGPEGTPGWGEQYQYQMADQAKILQVEQVGDQFRVTLGNSVYQVQARPGQAGRLDLEIDGRRLHAYVVNGEDKANPHICVWLEGETWTIQRNSERKNKVPERAGSDESNLTATMPGMVSAVMVAEGDQVVRGDPLVTLEAMKMELRLTAPRTGRIEKVYCTPGQVVVRGQLLVDFTKQ